MAFAVIARYTCAPEDVPAIRDALVAVRDQTRREPANLTYVVHEEADQEGVFVLYEQYVDRAGFEAHTRTPHFGTFVAGLIRPRLLDRTVHFAHVI